MIHLSHVLKRRLTMLSHMDSMADLRKFDRDYIDALWCDIDELRCDYAEHLRFPVAPMVAKEFYSFLKTIRAALEALTKAASILDRHISSGGTFSFRIGGNTVSANEEFEPITVALIDAMDIANEAWNSSVLVLETFCDDFKSGRYASRGEILQ